MHGLSRTFCKSPDLNKIPPQGKMAINQFSCLSLNEKKSLLVCYLVPSLILITEAMGFDID